MKSKNAFLLVATVLALILGSQVAEANCTVQNNSGQDLLILPVVDAAVSIVVNVGASVVLLAKQEHCYFQNKQSGHKKGPVQLADGVIYVIVDANVGAGKVNICVATVLGGILDIGAVIVAGI